MCMFQSKKIKDKIEADSRWLGAKRVSPGEARTHNPGIAQTYCL
jgi:hypothetical protein